MRAPRGARTRCKTLHDEIYRQKQAKHPQAVHRPAGGDHQARQRRHRACRGDPAPARRRSQPEADDEAENAGDNERNRHQQGQHGRRQIGVLESDDAGNGVKQAAQRPEQHAFPSLHLKGMKKLQHAAHQHHDPDIKDGGDGGDQKIAERDDAEGQKNEAKGQQPAPLCFQR